MDRNLGAMNTNNPGGGIGSIWYQFGRKDPFEGGTLYDTNGNKTSKTTIAWDATTQESSKKGKNVPYSVWNPLKFITNSTGGWTTGDQYCPANGGDFMWQDPKSAPSTDGKVKKSIFDPCPSGWMVPVNGVVISFSASMSSILDNGLGRYYYPAGTSAKEIYVFFPACGDLNSSNGGFERYNDAHYIYFWSCSPSSLSGMSILFNYYDDIRSEYASRAYGYSVRCVQHYY